MKLVLILGNYRRKGHFNTFGSSADATTVTLNRQAHDKTPPGGSFTADRVNIRIKS